MGLVINTEIRASTDKMDKKSFEIVLDEIRKVKCLLSVLLNLWFNIGCVL